MKNNNCKVNSEGKRSPLIDYLSHIQNLNSTVVNPI